MMLWPDPETTRQPNNAFVVAATPKAPVVPSIRAVAISRAIFLATPGTYVCFDPVKSISGNPALMRHPLVTMVAWRFLLYFRRTSWDSPSLDVTPPSLFVRWAVAGSVLPCYDAVACSMGDRSSSMDKVYSTTSYCCLIVCIPVYESSFPPWAVQ